MFPPNSDLAEITIDLPDERATRDLGAAVAAAAEPGMVVLLNGPLGAGKTTLVQGFVAAIGAAGVASPSFVLAHHYEGGRIPVRHLDLYRIETAAEIADLDLDQYLPQSGIALVEWAERASGEWPADSLEIRLSIEGRGRKAHIRGHLGSAAAVRAIASACATA